MITNGRLTNRNIESFKNQYTRAQDEFRDRQIKDHMKEPPAAKGLVEKGAGNPPDIKMVADAPPVRRQATKGLELKQPEI